VAAKGKIFDSLINNSSKGRLRLDLTAANHAILIEPQWNPMLEEQAISRVHRLRQTKRVNIVRFVMKGTFEQKIIDKQERKRVLADLVLGKSELKKGDAGKKQLFVSSYDRQSAYATD
jgi:SNF2 family DNA or RNA helicase